MKGDVVVEKITSTENLIDPFTKTLFTRVFNGHRVAFVSNVFPTCSKASRSLLGLSPRKHDKM